MHPCTLSHKLPYTSIKHTNYVCTISAHNCIALYAMLCALCLCVSARIAYLSRYLIITIKLSLGWQAMSSIHGPLSSTLCAFCSQIKFVVFEVVQQLFILPKLYYRQPFTVTQKYIHRTFSGACRFQPLLFYFALFVWPVCACVAQVLYALHSNAHQILPLASFGENVICFKFHQRIPPRATYFRFLSTILIIHIEI